MQQYNIKCISDANVLIDSFNLSKKGVTWKGSIQKYRINLLRNTCKLQKDLEQDVYRSSSFVEFPLSERGKTRWIKSMHIRDRVVQRAICDKVLLPELEKYLIYDNGASMEGKGVDFALNRLQHHLRQHYQKYGNEGYIVLVDFTKYFDNIPHEELLQGFLRDIEDEQLCNLIKYLVSLFEIEIGMLPQEMQKEFQHIFNNLKYSAYLKEHPQCLKQPYKSVKLKRSIGVGSQISQIGGVYYATRIDNFFKIVKGIKGYGRYMDDTYIICHTKEEAQSLLKDMYSLCKELKIHVNTKKTQIIPLNQSFSFLKIRHMMLSNGMISRKINKDTICRSRKRLKKLSRKLEEKKMTYSDVLCSFKSFQGRFKQFDGYWSLRNLNQLHDQLFIEDFLLKGDLYRE